MKLFASIYIGSYETTMKIFEIGKYTPVRGIKNFRSKTSQKMPNNPKVLDYNDLDDINKQLNFDIFNNKSSSSLMNIKYINKNDMNIVYHKKKLITPNLQSNYNSIFIILPFIFITT